MPGVTIIIGNLPYLYKADELKERRVLPTSKNVIFHVQHLDDVKERASIEKHHVVFPYTNLCH